MMGVGLSQSFSNLNVGGAQTGGSSSNLSQSTNALHFNSAFSQPNILVRIFVKKKKYSILRTAGAEETYHLNTLLFEI